MLEKSKIKIRTIIVFFLVILCLIIISIQPKSIKVMSDAESSQSISSQNQSHQLSDEMIEEDANQLVSVVESTHPVFSLHMVPDNYLKAKETFLSKAATSMTVDDFTWLVREYLSSLGDGHTFTLLFGGGDYLDIRWQASGNDLYLLNDDGTRSDQQVVAIGGTPVQNVFRTIAKYYCYENDSGMNFNNSQMSVEKSVLGLAGVKCDTNQITITIKSQNKLIYKNVPFVSPNDKKASSKQDVNSYKMIGDVFYINFRTCELDSDLSNVIHQLQLEIAKGVSKVIIDIRKNLGGDSIAGQKLLESMNMDIPQYGCYIRYSPLAKQQRNYAKQDGVDSFPPNLNLAKQNPQISLAVLTGESTFSSATMLGVWVQDGKLGKIIGQASMNSPSSYGDILQFQLKNSGIQCEVSHKRFLRPDTKNNQKILQPDIAVASNQDSLQVALKYLN